MKVILAAGYGAAGCVISPSLYGMCDKQTTITLVKSDGIKGAATLVVAFIFILNLLKNGWFRP